MERCAWRNSRNAADKPCKDAGLTDFGVKAEFETNIRLAVAVIIHIHDIANIGIEGKVIGSVRRLEKAIHVENHGHAIGVIVTYKSVPIGYIRGMVQCGDGASRWLDANALIGTAIRSAVVTRILI